MAFHNLWLLQFKQIHTMVVGAARPSGGQSNEVASPPLARLALFVDSCFVSFERACVLAWLRLDFDEHLDSLKYYDEESNDPRVSDAFAFCPRPTVGECHRRVSLVRRRAIGSAPD